MIELLVVVSLLGFLGWLEWTHAKERRYIINCLIARTPGEARVLNAPLGEKKTLVPVAAENFWSEDDIEGFEGQVGL